MEFLKFRVSVLVTSVLSLSGCDVSAVHFTCLPGGQPSGGAYVEFSLAAHHQMALQAGFHLSSKNVQGEWHAL